MKLSLNTLKKYVGLDESVKLEDLAQLLTMKTVELEAFEDYAAKYRNIVVGKINKVSPHPDADKLRVCMVDVGEGEDKQIVCGGSNLAEGQMVVVSKPGSYVVWHGEGEPVEIKAGKLRGVDSYGMICGANEVGLEELYPAKDDHEIVDLGNIGCEAGTNIADALELNDAVLEIDNKSLTNRPDLYSHYGIARELSAIFDKELKKLPGFNAPSGIGGIEIKIEDEDTRRFAALEIEGVSEKEAPNWMKNVLTLCGIRPKNAIIDITNYVNIVTGQPSHAYDRELVKGAFKSRRAKDGEKLELLDERVIELTAQDLVIADDEKALGLAGIMGGKEASSNANTKTLLVEVANFKPQSIRKSAKKFDIRTEASIRYEKNLDTARVDQALALLAELFSEVFPESKITAFGDNYPVNTGNTQIEVSLDFLRKRSGKMIEADEVVRILEKLEFSVEHKDGIFSITAPTFRSTGDVSIKDDILEEVTRMIGYDQFEAGEIKVELNKAINQKEVQIEHSTKLALSKVFGFHEIYTYPWIEDELIDAAGMKGDDFVRLANPPSPTSANLRSSLIPGLLFAIEKNLRYFEDFRVFELTQVFKPNKDKKDEKKEEHLPIQEKHLAFAIAGRDAAKIFYDLKGVAEHLPRLIMAEKLYFEQREKPTWADREAWLNIMFRGKIIGSLGLFSNRALAISGIKHSYAGACEVDVDKLVAFKSRTNKFAKLAVFPEVEKDLSVVLDEEVKFNEIERIVMKYASRCEFMDEYRGEQIPQGKKSIMFRYFLHSDKGTLSAKDIETSTNNIIAKLEEQLKCEVRH